MTTLAVVLVTAVTLFLWAACAHGVLKAWGDTRSTSNRVVVVVLGGILLGGILVVYAAILGGIL